MTSSVLFAQIGIIGTGRVARAFAHGLSSHSAQAPLLWGRTPGNLERAVAQAGRFRIAGDLSVLAGACDVIVIAVADDAIGPVVEQLAKALPARQPPFVCHVSGSRGTAVLDPLRQRGARTAAIHPVMTFTGDPQLEVERMAGARFAVTASDAEAGTLSRLIVSALGGVAAEVPEERRALYHAALCHAANHLVTLIAGSCDALAAAGVGDPGALLAPLARAALENSLEHGIDALSGPLLRGDTKTVAGHMEALDAHCPEVAPAYRAMALATLDEIGRSRGEPASQELHALLQPTQ